MLRFKKLLTGLLSAALLVTTGMSAFAAENIGTPARTYTIEVTNKDAGHTYEVYQIFTGDLSVDKDGNKVLSNVEFGANVDVDKVKAEFLGVETADDLAKYLEGVADVEGTYNQFKNVITTPYGTLTQSATVNADDLYSYTLSGLPAGYYLVKDKDGSLVDADGNPMDTAYTKMILQVVGDVTIAAKSESPSVLKKVVEETYKQDAGFGYGYNDVADYDIGDTIPFELIGSTVNVETIKDYTDYNYEFHDSQSEGLTFDKDSFKVYVAVSGKIDDNMVEVDPSLYTVTFSNNDHDMMVAMDLKNDYFLNTLTTTSRIVVRYTSKLNANAVIGLPGNPNEVYLEYSNSPYDNDSKGRTPKDKVIVFTYRLDTLKYDGASKDKEEVDPLKGAEFKLLKKDGNTVTEVAEITDGKISAWVAAEFDEDGNLTNGSILVSGDDGFFKVAGLDEGTYYLREVKAPEGFNLLTSDVKIVVDADCVNTQDWDGTPEEALKGFNDQAENIKKAIDDSAKPGVEVWVENNRGVILPSTGGIGTTIFYIVGGVLIVSAIAFFALRRKNQA